jgi:hypothetical protein
MKTLCDEWSKNEDGLIPPQSPSSTAGKSEATETRSRAGPEIVDLQMVIRYLVSFLVGIGLFSVLMWALSWLI